jgi:hypothetical protein
VGGELPASAVHYVQLLAAVGIITEVGVSSEDVLEDLLGGLIPEVPFSRDHITVVDSLLARPAARWCNALNFGVEFFFLFFTRQIRALPFPFSFPLAKP